MPTLRARVVVIGAGVAGVAAAAAFSRAGHHVVVVERDQLPDVPRVRRGVPQGTQLHNLLARAQIHLEQLLPGFLEDLLAAGGVRVDVAGGTDVFELGIRIPRRSFNLSLVCAERPVIEHTLHRLLVQHEDVEIREGQRAAGITVDADVVTGVELDGGGHIHADFVVDAAGSGALSARWLEEAGRQTPPVERRRTRQWYATVTVTRPLQWHGVPRSWMVFPSPPDTRGALLSPLGSNRWHLSLSGAPPHAPTRSMDDVRAHLASIGDGSIAELVAGSAPTQRLFLFRKLEATWRHFERIQEPTIGLLPIGDSFASLNPLLGQGMSVAAWQAAELSRLAATASGVALTKAFLATAAGVIEHAWHLGRLVGPAGQEAADLAMRLLYDPEEHERYVRSWHLLGSNDPPVS